VRYLALIAMVSTIAAWSSADDAGLERTFAAHLGYGGPYAAQIEYQDGIGYYEQGRYAEALTRFRQAAIADPETHHLAAYMVHAEHEADRAEAIRLGAAKEILFQESVTEGKESLENERYEQAEQAFKKALAIKPDNVEAQGLLARAIDAPRAARRTVPHRTAKAGGSVHDTAAPDPLAAQRHYQAGLVAYAKHDLQEARKEWLLTARLDSRHPKVFQAINRVDQELTLVESPGELKSRPTTSAH
jgi:tetratricopeptide (TPR) repeat protein